MGGPNSLFNDPLNQRRGREDEALLPGVDRRNRLIKLEKDILKATKSGKLSKQTSMELQAALDKRRYGEYSSKTGEFRTSDEASFEKDARYDTLLKIFEGETKGTSKAGRSRVATQKMFETLVDRPGSKQTMLTPRSNASKSILGV